MPCPLSTCKVGVEDLDKEDVVTLRQFIIYLYLCMITLLLPRFGRSEY